MLTLSVVDIPDIPLARFALGATDHLGRLCAMVTVCHPVYSLDEDGVTLEVTDSMGELIGNAAPLLYTAAWRAARGLGYKRLLSREHTGFTGEVLQGLGWRKAEVFTLNGEVLWEVRA
ncbi:XF1762 family protein [Phytomonospora sp. NPDC050363]|uniref:XF1762 family protein n=1 Tax=Phytomonospora sp. NPDC050363 TaxID=3155642 RepID=UPI0033FE85BF